VRELGGIVCVKQAVWCHVNQIEAQTDMEVRITSKSESGLRSAVWICVREALCWYRGYAKEKLVPSVFIGILSDSSKYMSLSRIDAEGKKGMYSRSSGYLHANSSVGRVIKVVIQADRSNSAVDVPFRC
jgi:hypothetical protein